MHHSIEHLSVMLDQVYYHQNYSNVNIADTHMHEIQLSGNNGYILPHHFLFKGISPPTRSTMIGAQPPIAALPSVHLLS